MWWLQDGDDWSFTEVLVLESSGGQNTHWEMVSGGDKVELSSDSGETVEVYASGNAFSSSYGDIRITASVADLASAEFQATAKAPKKFTTDAYWPNT